MEVARIEYAIPSDTLLQPCRAVDIRYSTNGDLIMSLIELDTQYKLCSARIFAIIKYFDSIKILNGDTYGK